MSAYYFSIILLLWWCINRIKWTIRVTGLVVSESLLVFYQLETYHALLNHFDILYAIIWKVALYDIIHDIISLWYWLWYHMFWFVYDIILLWYHKPMISWFYIYDIIPLQCMISVTHDIIGPCYHYQYHMQNHIWYHGIKTMISYFSIYDISNLWYHRSKIS